jgi:hypothetical protein
MNMLTPCTTCQTPIAPTAQACPHCGAPPRPLVVIGAVTDLGQALVWFAIALYMAIKFGFIG